MKQSLAALVRADLDRFLGRDNHELFFNENDMQMHLALYLRRNPEYDDVDIEYYIPYRQLDGYLWNNELYLDIVVRRGAEYVPVELKYATRRICRRIERFGEILPEDVEIVKTQGAQDFTTYNFWKDVRRLELVRRRFPAVVGGFAVMLSNDPHYEKGRRPGANSEQMSMEAGEHKNRSRHWLRTPGGTVKNGVCTHPDFDLDNVYSVNWQDAAIDETPRFRYTIIEV